MAFHGETKVTVPANVGMMYKFTYTKINNYVHRSLTYMTRSNKRIPTNR